MNLQPIVYAAVLSNKLRKEIRSLDRKKGRDQLGTCLVEGERSVASALEAGTMLSHVLYTSSFVDSALIKRVLEAGIDRIEVTEKDMRSLSPVSTPQGVMAVAASPLVDPAKLLGLPSVLVLDALQDPGNVGTLIRTAAWFGMDGVLAAPGTADLLSPKVVRATMGGIWDVRMSHVRSMEDWLHSWSESGGIIVAADLSGEKCSDWVAAPKTVLIVGGEANGLSDSIRKMINTYVHISRQGAGKGTESLNAAIAGGIIMARWSDCISG